MSRNGFTVVELLVVITIILILAGLVLSTTGYVQNKAGRARAQSEIQAISAACENYKADNGVYPSAANSDALDARTDTNPTVDPGKTRYINASVVLYRALIGDVNPIDGQTDAGAKIYMSFKNNQLGGLDSSGNSNTGTYIADPFGNSYGYSTAYQADLNKTPPINPPTHGYNPTFDLWSTAGSTSTTAGWVTNW